jgi:hypothetical protein
MWLVFSFPLSKIVIEVIEGVLRRTESPDFCCWLVCQQLTHHVPRKGSVSIVVNMLRIIKSLFLKVNKLVKKLSITVNAQNFSLLLLNFF